MSWHGCNSLAPSHRNWHAFQLNQLPRGTPPIIAGSSHDEFASLLVLGAVRAAQRRSRMLCLRPRLRRHGVRGGTHRAARCAAGARQPVAARVPQASRQNVGLTHEPAQPDRAVRAPGRHLRPRARPVQHQRPRRLVSEHPRIGACSTPLAPPTLCSHPPCAPVRPASRPVPPTHAGALVLPSSGSSTGTELICSLSSSRRVPRVARRVAGGCRTGTSRRRTRMRPPRGWCSSTRPSARCTRGQNKLTRTPSPSPSSTFHSQRSLLTLPSHFIINSFTTPPL